MERYSGIRRNKLGLLSEDPHQQSSKADTLIDRMSHFLGQHDYEGPEWGGVEKFNFELSAASGSPAAVESKGWYKYDSSLRPDMDGKNWRLTVKDEIPVAVNCHSMLHDNVWTLSTTIYSTEEIDQSKLDFMYDT